MKTMVLSLGDADLRQNESLIQAENNIRIFFNLKHNSQGLCLSFTRGSQILSEQKMVTLS